MRERREIVDIIVEDMGSSSHSRSFTSRLPFKIHEIREKTESRNEECILTNGKGRDSSTEQTS